LEEDAMNYLHEHGRHGQPPPDQSVATSGSVLHAPRFYDALAFILSLGREKAIRRATIEAAGLTPGQSVLDVGAGTGSLTLTAKRAVGPSGRVVGVEPAPKMVEYARAKAARSGTDVEFRVASIEALPFEEAAFDVVLSSLMLHHLPEKAKRLGFAEVVRILRPGGLFFAVDFGKTPHGLLGTLLRHRAGHLSPHEIRKLQEMLAEAGMRDVTTGPLEIGSLVFLKARS
jgi:ubiquinone/menaquinone biosynthesis C-methylase UbiE